MYSQNKQMQTVKLEGTHLQRGLHVKKTNKKQNGMEKKQQLKPRTVLSIKKTQ